MNLLKNGFSLAEMLITLAIIGVVATITMPALQVNTQKAQVIPALKKAVNTLETVNQQIIHDYEVRALRSVLEDDWSNYDELLKNYLVGSTRAGANYFFNTENGGIGANTAIVGKDSIAFFVYNGAEIDGRTYRQVAVDTNGVKAPNRFGKDVFIVYVDSIDGSVTPKGSTSLATQDQSNWTNKCANDSEPVDPQYCFGAIVENGWEIRYKY